MDFKTLKNRIENAIVEALNGENFDIDEWDAKFLDEAIEDIASIYFESRIIGNKERDEIIAERILDEIMEERNNNENLKN